MIKIFHLFSTKLKPEAPYIEHTQTLTNEREGEEERSVTDEEEKWQNGKLISKVHLSMNVSFRGEVIETMKS